MVNSISGGGGGFSPAMLHQKMEERFKAADVDQSGGVSKDEMLEAVSQHGGDAAKVDKIFSKLDADGNGEVTLQEQQTAVEERFGQLMGGGGEGFSFSQSSVDNVTTLLEALQEGTDDGNFKSAIEEMLGQIDSGNLGDDALGSELQGLLSQYLPRISVTA